MGGRHGPWYPGAVRLRTVVLLLALAWLAYRYLFWSDDPDPSTMSPVTATTEVSRASDRAITEAFAQRRSDVMVESSGRVSRVLPDDEEGSRHQRFILELASGHTVLIAHNIDLAPRVPLAVGDTVEFEGEYEWNDRGGVVHWTHHDPDGDHPGGWLRHEGKIYR